MTELGPDSGQALWSPAYYCRGSLPRHPIFLLLKLKNSFSWPTHAFRNTGRGPVLRHSLSELWSQGSLQESVGLPDPGNETPGEASGGGGMQGPRDQHWVSDTLDGIRACYFQEKPFQEHPGTQTVGLRCSHNF